MEFLIIIGVIIFSVILHEVAHGWVAEKLGDPTARVMGRITLNPIPHIDPFMTLLLPISMFILSGGNLLFAAAKPVPVNPLYLKDGKKDMALVALAGPVTNILIAGVFAILFHVVGGNDIILRIIIINLYLAILNLVPIPPLDGSKIISIFFSDEMAYRYQSMGQIGMIILFALLFIPIGTFSLGTILLTIVFSLVRLFGIPV
jgi:Zn-dependent protease